MKVHIKDIPTKHRFLTLYCCHPQDMPGMRRSGDPMKRMVIFKCGGPLHQAGWGGLGQGRGALEVEDRKIRGGRVATSIPKALWTVTQWSDDLWPSSPLSCTLCGPLLPDTVWAEFPTLTINSFPVCESTDLLRGNCLLTDRLASARGPPRFWSSVAPERWVQYQLQFYIYY